MSLGNSKHWSKWHAGPDFGHPSTFSGGTDHKKQNSKNPEKLQKASFGGIYLIKNLLVINKKVAYYIKN